MYFSEAAWYAQKAKDMIKRDYGFSERQFDNLVEKEAFKAIQPNGVNIEEKIFYNKEVNTILSHPTLLLTMQLYAVNTLLDEAGDAHKERALEQLDQMCGKTFPRELLTNTDMVKIEKPSVFRGLINSFTKNGSEMTAAGWDLRHKTMQYNGPQ